MLLSDRNGFDFNQIHNISSTSGILSRKALIIVLHELEINDAEKLSVMLEHGLL